MARTGPRYASRKGADITCSACGKSFYLPPSKIKRGEKSCSIKCRDVLKRLVTHNDAERTKKCACCGEWKSFDDFANQAGSKVSVNGESRQAYCRICSAAKSKEWAEANPAEKKRHRADSYWRNPDKYRAEKRGMSLEKRAIKNARQREWRKANMDKVLMWNRLRVHRQRCAGDMPDRIDIEALLCSQDARCTYCGVLLVDGFHIDHKTPVSRDGKNDIENIQLLCQTCNLKKSSKTHDEYAAMVGIAQKQPIGDSLRFLDVDAFCSAMSLGDYTAGLELVRSAAEALSTSRMTIRKLSEKI